MLGNHCGGTSLFGRLNIWVFKCEETKNLENHRKTEEVKIDSLKL